MPQHENIMNLPDILLHIILKYNAACYFSYRQYLYINAFVSTATKYATYLLVV
jgi:hypothetical protein